jgi:hypothetical protein
MFCAVYIRVPQTVLTRGDSVMSYRYAPANVIEMLRATKGTIHTLGGRQKAFVRKVRAPQSNYQCCGQEGKGQGKCHDGRRSS